MNINTFLNLLPIKKYSVCLSQIFHISIQFRPAMKGILTRNLNKLDNNAQENIIFGTEE